MSKEYTVMGTEKLSKNDYRYLIADENGNATCDSCGNFELVNAYWPHSGKKICTACSHINSILFNYMDLKYTDAS